MANGQESASNILLEKLHIGTEEKMRFKCPSWNEFQSVLVRKKVITGTSSSQLVKVLTTFDLTALGIGSTLGVGIYVLAGDVAKNTTGPAVVLAFFIAALTSILAGLCYAEFGARVPKAGSAYVYSYVCIGEFIAFIIGWNLVLEYLIGSAASTKAIFLYIDELANNKMTIFFEENMPLTGNQIATYADVFSLGLAVIFSIALAFGAKESSWINNVCTVTNIGVVLIVIISGFWKVDTSNWTKTKEEANQHGNYGEGGFFPYGIKGVIKGAARCFYGFIGFDCIATAGEEAKSPNKSIPIAVVMSLLIVFLAYFGMSTVMTMILPYYEQNENAPLPYIYNRLDWVVIKYIVSIGAISGLFSSLLGAMFPLPRIIYAMATDGLLFKSLGKVHSQFHTPFMGTLISGTLTGVLACILELTKLTEMMSIGTLSAYSMVAVCVLVLRYSPEPNSNKPENPNEVLVLKDYYNQIFNRQLKDPTSVSSTIVACEIIIFFCLSVVLSCLMTIYEDDLFRATPWLLAVSSVLFMSLIILLVLISFQPSANKSLGFSVPLVPWIPGTSIFVNTYLMTNIYSDTWIKYAFWLLIGLLIYVTYGVWHSKERPSNKTIEENQISDDEATTNSSALKKSTPGR